MKLGRFKIRDRIFTGVVNGERVIDLSKTAALLSEFQMLEINFSEMRFLLAHLGKLAQMLEVAKDNCIDYLLADLKVLPPLADPDKIICIGLNYNEHAAESEMDLPKEPVFFCKFKSSIIGPEEAIIIPKVSEQIDYEAELAVIIGQPGKHIPETQAMEHVAGNTCFNDVSARDLQFRGGQWIKGKALDTFAPLGPYIVTQILII